MSNASKGARLYLKGGPKPVWIIRDGATRRSTGCGKTDLSGAEGRLAEYIAAKHEPARNARDPASVPIADVIGVYASDRGVAVVRRGELAQRLDALLNFWGTRYLNDVNGAACRAYALARGSQSMARRELEDLRAAINHHRREGMCNAVVEVSLPPKSVPRERWLTRVEAAALLRAAWRNPNRRHVARFILVGLYTGTRSGAICGASLTRVAGRGHVDLDAGTWVRKAVGARETNKRQPAIRIPARLLTHMRRWRERGLVIHSLIEFNGAAVTSVRKAFAQAAADAGLADVSPHTLRHTAVSWAMQAGADIDRAARFFGLTRDMIERVYGHQRPDHLEDIGLAVTGRLRAGQAEQTTTNAAKRPSRS